MENLIADAENRLNIFKNLYEKARETLSFKIHRRADGFELTVRTNTSFILRVFITTRITLDFVCEELQNHLFHLVSCYP